MRVAGSSWGSSSYFRGWGKVGSTIPGRVLCTEIYCNYRGQSSLDPKPCAEQYFPTQTREHQLQQDKGVVRLGSLVDWLVDLSICLGRILNTALEYKVLRTDFQPPENPPKSAVLLGVHILSRCHSNRQLKSVT